MILLSLVGSRSRQLLGAKGECTRRPCVLECDGWRVCRRHPYFAREILVPIAMAVLLSFMPAPLVRILQRLKIPRTLAVMGAVGTAFITTFSLATMVMVEVNQLANDLPPL